VHRSAWGRLVLLAVASASPLLAAANEPLPQVGATVRWQDVAAAAERHPVLAEASARARGAAGAVTSARELPNPVLGLSAGSGRPRDGGASRREWGYSVDLPLDFLATRGARVAAASASAEGAQQDARSVRAQVLRDLRRSFVELVHDQAVVEAGTELEGQVAQLAALVRKRAERGEGRPTEVPRVEIELERLRSALDRSRAAAEAQRQRLATWLGTPVSRAEADLSSALQLPPFDDLRERVLAGSPAVQAARARLQAATEEASAERWERFPKVSIGAARAEELDRAATTFSASVAIPFWNWNQGKIRQADAAVEGELARLDALSRELSAQVGSAWQGCAAGQAAVRRFQVEILPRAEGSARTLGRAFELGEAGLLDVIDARRVLLDTRREYLDLLLDMQNACGDLAALAGLELP
jgi:cobalt-zinc-cadmium efflux system outer membrane protein